ncbi:MAG: T9SS type A sorting domain-containing protein, partial [Flavobacteriales bacterium]|nr:T9SS type A sorting domain-containing protein [Flavobacteriales bacterium]
VTTQAKEIFLNMASSGSRPDITFYSGEYESTLDSTIVSFPSAHTMSSVIETLPFIDQDVSGISYDYVDTNYVYLNSPSITYAPDGSVTDVEEPNSDLYFANLFKQNRHQLQNYVTPYGIGLSLGPDGFRWQYEVTDYRDLFKGWVEIRAGNQQELIDLEFEFIEGTPPREVLEMETIWLGNYGHAAIADDIVMPAVDRTMRADASSFGLRTRTTGHWFGGVLNCAEFCPKNFNIQIDGVEQFEWLNWKECADNPVISQGGTWIYDRAGWCPGTFADTYDHDITPYVTPGGTHSIDFGMQPYVTNGGEGNYWTTLQFFQYGDYNHQLDVEVVDIVSPNTWEFHNRYNPICKDPEIEIRNVGSETVTTMDITYWVTEGQSITYEWTGELAFSEKERVLLPVADQGFWAYNGETKFHVEVSNPNGQADEYADNDIMSSEFEYPDLHSEPFYIWFKSNNFPNENSYAVYDEMGNTVFERTSFSPNTQYKDTLYLPDGCYSIRLNDLGHDGLSFFANNDGTGYFRLRYVSGSVIEYFDGDFGSFINYQFQMDTEVGLSENLDEELIQIHPNPSNGQFTLSIDMYEGSVLDLEILDSKGKQVYSEEGSMMIDRLRKNIDLSDLSDGIYFARILIDGRQVVRKLIKN